MEPKLRAWGGVTWRGLLWICAAQLSWQDKENQEHVFSDHRDLVGFISQYHSKINSSSSLRFPQMSPQTEQWGDLMGFGQSDGGDWGRVCSEPCCSYQIPSKYTGPLQRRPSVSKRNDSHWLLLPPCTLEETFSNWLKTQFCELGLYIQIHLI